MTNYTSNLYQSSPAAMNDEDGGGAQNPPRPEKIIIMTQDHEQDFLQQNGDYHHHHHQLSSSPKKIINDDHDELGLSLGLSLGLPSSPTATPPPFPFPIPPPATFLPEARPISPNPSPYPGPSRRPPLRRKISRPRQAGKSDTVPAPYPWATNERATVHDLEYLVSNNLSKISGMVQCKRCEKQFEIEYDLQEKFNQVYSFILEKNVSMHQRAPDVWMNPVLPPCRFCKQDNSAKPVIAEKKKAINWLFLLLGQMLGCCNLKQIKYFCKHSNNHKTGAKDRILYLTYLGLCNQLYPDGPLDSPSS